MDINKIVNKLFKSLLNSSKEVIEYKMKGNKFVFDYVVD